MKVQLLEFPTTPSVPHNNSLLLSLIDDRADVVVLPELWNVPYVNSEIQAACDFQEQSYLAMKTAATAKSVWLTGTIPYEGKNMAFVFDDTGQEVARYAKTHLMEVHTERHFYSEAEVFEPGDEFVDFDTPWGRAGILVCYDIRFPEPARILRNRGISFLFLPAAFNASVGPKHWKALLTARAIENQIYVIGVNPDYEYGNYRSYGHSMIISPDGEETDTIDPDLVKKIRTRMPYETIKRNDLYKLEDKS